MGYRVKAAAAVGYRSNGSHWMGYQNQPVPDGVLDKDELKRLEEGGFIESDEEKKSSHTSK
ncbi:MAG TPA: hypothetical protein VFH56_10960 [Acidimicrobiales bacterium]|nr:hypothetical protein [Acidimicrobiales bacterium]